MDELKLTPRVLVMIVAVALGFGATVTVTAVRYLTGAASAPPGPAAVAASVAFPDDESVRIHRELRDLLQTIERRDRAVCLMLGAFTDAAPAVMELCR
jgi:hypothetical protein